MQKLNLFYYLKTLILSFTNFQNGQLINKNDIEVEFQKIRTLGINIPNLQENDFIKSSDFNNSFSAMLTNTLAYNSEPVLTNSSLVLNGDLNISLSVVNPIINYENDPITYHAVSGPSNGLLITESGVYKYVPNLNYYGNDSFSYRVSDGSKYSNTVNVSVSLVGRGIVTKNNVKTFFDNTTKKSCNDYKISTDSIYGYTGSTGDGIYKISYNGETVDVYCDMTTDGGGWTLAVKTGNIPQIKDGNQTRTLVTGSSSVNYLTTPNFTGMGDTYGKLSNNMINGIKRSTATNDIPSYRWERDTQRLGDRYFISGNCHFQARTGAQMSVSADYCTKSANIWNATSYISNPNMYWCNQPNMPHVYFCINAPVSFQVVTNFEYAADHNWAYNRIWIK